MEEQDKFGQVSKHCDERRWNWTENEGARFAESPELTVGSVWILDHADQLRQIAKSENWSAYSIATLEKLVEEGKVQKSYQELEAKHGEKVLAFFKQITVLMASWQNCKLFWKSTAFQKQFRHTHMLIVSGMWDNTIIQLARLLTDGKTVGGRRRIKVLSIDTLVDEVLDGNVKKQAFEERIKKVKELPVVMNLVNEWRNNRLAHNNYEAALGLTQLSPVNIAEVDGAIEKFVAIFHEMARELGNTYEVSVKYFTIPDFAEEISRLGFEKFAEIQSLDSQVITRAQNGSKEAPVKTGME